jgi:N-acetyl-alpha-D-muramate 1-phosphate uridylyltransferase
MINSLCLLAGGFATRLRPHTEKIPKSLLEINGKPFIEYQLELLKKNGIENIVICAGFLGEQIQEYINKINPDTGINFSFDGEKLLGTGGAVKKALPLLDDPFFIMYGDSYLDTDFKIINEYFLQNRKHGLMTIFKNNGKWDKSNVIFKDGKIIEYDKNKKENKDYIDYGLGILTHEAFEDFKNESVFDLEEVYKSLLKNNELLGYEIKERFYEIGSFEGIEETSKYLSSFKK